MKRDLPRYVYKHVDRFRKVRFYFRPPSGGTTCLSGAPGTEEFQASYEAARLARTEPRDNERVVLTSASPRTVRWLCEQYFKSRDFRNLDPRTQHVRRLVIESSLKEPLEPGATDLFADCPLEFVTPKVMKVIRDRKADFPESANSRIKSFRQVYAWALEEDIEEATIRTNPARDVKFLRSNSQGHHSWTIGEVEKFESRHPVGSRARLALALLLYTGQRRSDVIAFGRQHVRDGWITFTQFKNRNRKPVTLEIPIIPELAKIISASPCGDLTFLVNELGRPYTAAGFGNKMRQWCDEAQLTRCSAHGLRKAAAGRLAELGCTDAEIMSITGHTTRKEIDRYTKGARQRHLAENVLRRITGGQNDR